MAVLSAGALEAAVLIGVGCCAGAVAQGISAPKAATTQSRLVKLLMVNLQIVQFRLRYLQEVYRARSLKAIILIGGLVNEAQFLTVLTHKLRVSVLKP